MIETIIALTLIYICFDLIIMLIGLAINAIMFGFIIIYVILFGSYERFIAQRELMGSVKPHEDPTDLRNYYHY